MYVLTICAHGLFYNGSSIDSVPACMDAVSGIDNHFEFATTDKHCYTRILLLHLSTCRHLASSLPTKTNARFCNKPNTIYKFPSQPEASSAATARHVDRHALPQQFPKRERTGTSRCPYASLWPHLPFRIIPLNASLDQKTTVLFW